MSKQPKSFKYSSCIFSLLRFELMILWWHWKSSLTVNFVTYVGTFKLTLQFSEDYPNKPPTVRFVSRMFHPNSNLPHLLSIISLIPPDSNTFHILPSISSIILNWSSGKNGLTSFCISSVYADGSICLDILQNQWSPIYDVAAILTSIQVPFWSD